MAVGWGTPCWFTHTDAFSHSHSSQKRFLSTYYVPGAVLGTRGPPPQDSHRGPCCWERWFPGAGGGGRQKGYLTVLGPERTGRPQAVRDGFLGEVCRCGTSGPPEKWDPQGGRGRSKKEGWRRGDWDGHQLVSPDQEGGGFFPRATGVGGKAGLSVEVG